MNTVVNTSGGLDWLHIAHTYITEEKIFNLFWAILIMVVGIFLSRRVEGLVNRLKQLELSQRALFTRFAKYGVITIAAASALAQLGFDLRVLLGAAGILTVAIGFAAQTSASNLISGIFLMIEKPFVIGDVVDVAGTRGEVMAIDLISCKIRLFSNLMVRIPNETMVKSNITNLSYFPIRRFDIAVGIGYKSDVKAVRALMFKAAHDHPLCLTEPEPIFTFSGFGDSSMNVLFQAWTMKDDVLKVQTELFIDIKERFDKAGIEIPFPIRTIQVEGGWPAPAPTIKV
jgi:small-conductance mechanosensitive channel